MSAKRGYTLIELMLVVAIIGILAGIIILNGNSARQNAGLAGSVYELTLLIQGLQGRAIHESQDFLLVVVDAEADREKCRFSRKACAHYFVLRDRELKFDLSKFKLATPYATAERADDDDYLPYGFLGTNAWTPPDPFKTGWVTGLESCGTRPCFALRFTGGGDVEPVPSITPLPAGYAFSVNPVHVENLATERRAVFVSFPAGIVKTGTF